MDCAGVVVVEKWVTTLSSVVFLNYVLYYIMI